jgi:DnaJ-class molecular chaperone
LFRKKMSAPQDEKKKLVRELQLKYHPDKCEDKFAKTVFQFVNSNKPWFMQDLPD